MTDRTQPNSDELLSELTDSLKPQGELRPLCLQAASHIADLKARIAELESNERAYEEIIGKMTYREVADRIKDLEGALHTARSIIDPDSDPPRKGLREIVAEIDAALEAKDDEKRGECTRGLSISSPICEAGK